MKVKGNITFGRNSSNEITIKLQDEASGITFAVARLDSNQQRQVVDFIGDHSAV